VTQKLRPALVILASILAVTTLAACPASRKPPAEAKGTAIEGDQPMTGEAPFDEGAFREALQGHWRVSRGERVLFEFSFEGATAKVVDRRFTTAREISGPLKIRSATGFGITDTDGVSYYYSAVFDGKEAFMGLGAAIETEEGEAFTARIGAWERLVREEGQEGCRYIKTWGGSTSEETVACELKQKGDRTIFTYQSEDPFRPGKLKTYELTVVGDYLLGKELADARAERYDPKKEAATKPATTDKPTKTAEPTSPAGKPETTPPATSQKKKPTAPIPKATKTPPTTRPPAPTTKAIPTPAKAPTPTPSPK
jgi:hypothetical protein